MRTTITLQRCADCAYWEPALTYFGEPTERGGCRFAVARNRKGHLPRECNKYKGGKQIEAEVRSQEAKGLKSLIHFWKGTLVECRLLISPSTKYMVEQTIVNLENLKQIKEAEYGSRDKTLERG
ncbi:hypothetical protein ACFLVE_02475 [Chloroflexota bacterium]